MHPVLEVMCGQYVEFPSRKLVSIATVECEIFVNKNMITLFLSGKWNVYI